MSPLELFRKWHKEQECTAEEAWMAGYAAGCHRGHENGKGTGRAESARELKVLRHALCDLLDLLPPALVQFGADRSHDARNDDYVLAKLVSELRRAQQLGTTDEERGRTEMAQAAD